MPIGIASLLTLIILAVIIAMIVALALAFRGLRRNAHRGGFRSVGEYLKAVPRTDEEKQEAVDLALKGMAICLAGLVLPPLVLIGLFPLYYGTRKFINASMGFGLVDDGDLPEA